MNEERGSRKGSGVLALPAAIATVMALAGIRLLGFGTATAISGGVLLLVAALAAAGVAFGAREFGPDQEGLLDLSARIGLGLLAGLLAGLLHGVLTEAAGWLGLASALRAGINVDLSAADWWHRAAFGAMSGCAMGLFWTRLPGGGHLERGAVFGIVLAAWQLFYVYPVRSSLGVAGIDAGGGVAPMVIVGLVLVSVVASWIIGWGGRSEIAPLGSSLVD